MAAQQKLTAYTDREIVKRKYGRRYYYVATENGVVVSRRLVSAFKGRGGEQRARSIFRTTGTFYLDRWRNTKDYYRVTEHAQILDYDSKKQKWRGGIDRWRQPKRATGPSRGQYFFNASVRGQRVYAASAYGTRRSLKDMRSQALDRFLRAVAAVLGDGSDPDEGLRYMEKRHWRGVNEGVKYFTPKARYSAEYYGTGGMGRQDVAPVFNTGTEQDNAAA